MALSFEFIGIFFKINTNRIFSSDRINFNKQRIYKVLETAKKVYESRSRQIPTSELNERLLPIVKEQNPPPAYKGKYVKIKYIMQLKTAYPQFVFYCNLPQYIKDPYKRFVENRLREMYDFKGVPITIFFRQK